MIHIFTLGYSLYHIKRSLNIENYQYGGSFCIVAYISNAWIRDIKALSFHIQSHIYMNPIQFGYQIFKILTPPRPYP